MRKSSIAEEMNQKGDESKSISFFHQEQFLNIHFPLTIIIKCEQYSIGPLHRLLIEKMNRYFLFSMNLNAEGVFENLINDLYLYSYLICIFLK